MSKAITIAIKNNTTTVQAVQLGITPNVFSGINATTQYRWDITTQNLNDLTTVDLTYVLNGITTTVSADIQSESVEGIISALNSLGVGRFWSTISGGSTFINTYNDFVTYTNLVINNAHNIQMGVTVGIGATIDLSFTLVAPNQLFVDWGDGTVDEFNVNNPNPSHTYTTAGTYNILITVVTPASLTVINVINEPQITSLDLIGNVFTSLQTILFVTTGITTFDTSSITNSTSLTSVSLQGNQLSSFDPAPLTNNVQFLALTQNDITSFDASNMPSSITSFFIVNNQISVADVNAILIKLDTEGLLNGNVQTVGQTPAAPPSGAGITAANNLIGKGWTVLTD